MAKRTKVSEKQGVHIHQNWMSRKDVWRCIWGIQHRHLCISKNPSYPRQVSLYKAQRTCQSNSNLSIFTFVNNTYCNRIKYVSDGLFVYVCTSNIQDERKCNVAFKNYHEKLRTKCKIKILIIYTKLYIHKLQERKCYQFSRQGRGYTKTEGHSSPSSWPE